MKLKNKSVLVTGAAGFIGSHMSESLISDGNSVVGVDCFTDYYNPDLKRQNIEFLEENASFELIEKKISDIPLYTIFDDVDAVFHLAAQAGVRASWGQEFNEYVEQNIQSTQILLEALKSYTERIPFLLASSSSVYGIPDESPMRESMRTQPYSPYGVTKLAAENLSMLYAHNFDLPISALRLFTVFGPRQRPDMAFTRFLTWISDGRSLEIYGDGTQTRDFTYVSDVADAFKSVLRSDAFGNVYNVGGGNHTSLNSVIEIMENITDIPVERSYSETQKGDVPDTDADTSLIRENTDWSPVVDLEDGLVKQWQWVRDNECLHRSID